MRALSGAKDPEHVADSIIHHPSVRFGLRPKLGSQKAVSEGGRSMVYECAKLVDKMTDCERAGDHKGAKEVRSDASDGLWPLMASDGL
jgi:hypothetical protein